MGQRWSYFVFFPRQVTPIYMVDWTCRFRRLHVEDTKASIVYFSKEITLRDCFSSYRDSARLTISEFLTELRVFNGRCSTTVGVMRWGGRLFLVFRLISGCDPEM